MEVSKQCSTLSNYFSKDVVNEIIIFISPYKSTRYHLSKYFPNDIVREIQKLLLPILPISNKRIKYSLFQSIIQFYNYKRYVRKKKYVNKKEFNVKNIIKYFNLHKQINSKTNYDFYKTYCVKCNKRINKCEHDDPYEPSTNINMFATNYNIMRIMDGISGLSFSC